MHSNTIFTTEILIRPDDIDLNNHVHSSKYLDYVLAARFIQMRDDYKFPMEYYHERKLNWVASTYHIDFKRGLKFNDSALVKTQFDEVNGSNVKVNFWIHSKKSGKLSAEGYFLFTLISLESGRPVRIPEEIIEKHTF